MEVKVFVDGVPRVVCGVTEHTTCQEAVIALAQALGRPGRYTLKEKFKDFERCVSPSERLLEALQKYGEHGKEVQLTLLLNPRPALPWDPVPSGRTADLRDPPAPPVRRRRPDPGTRPRKGSGTLAVSTHRQSLPALSQSQQEEEGPLEEVKRPKRKSLTLLDAWGWLGSLGRGRLHYCVRDPERNQKTGKKSDGDLREGSLGSGPAGSGSVASKEDWGQDGFLSCVRRRKRERQCREHRASSCTSTKNPEEDGQRFRKLSVGSKDGALWSQDQTLGSKDPTLGSKDRALWTKDQTLGSKSEANRTDRSEDEKALLREQIMSQGCRLRDLQLQITSVDHQICELEVQQTESQAQLEAQRAATEVEAKEVLFWEEELRKEQGFERDIQAQFLEMREKARECRAELEEYWDKMQLLALSAGAKTLVPETVVEEDPGILGKAVTEISTVVETSDGADSVNTGRKETPSQPHASVPGHQIKERRLTGPTELREWWKRWSETHSPAAEPQPHVHRSELTIYLGSARV